MTAGFVIWCKHHRTLKAVRAGDEHAKAAFEPIGGDPSFVRSFGVFATRDDGRFDALATVAGESFDVEDRQRHTAQFYDQTDAWS